MTNPDLQETVERLGVLSRLTHTEDMPARRIRELGFNCLTLLKAQQERIAELEAELRTQRTKYVRVRAFAARSLGVAENEEYPYSKGELRKALQDAVGVIAKIAHDHVAQTGDREWELK